MRTRAQTAAGATAIQSGERSITYGELDRLVGAATSILGDLGVSEGRRVASLMRDDWRSVVLLFALARLGAVFVPLNRREPRANQVEQVKVALTEWCIVDKDDLDGPFSTLSWSELFSQPTASTRAAADPELDPELDPECPLTILFTSGSGGRRTGIVHTLSAHWFSALGSSANIPVDADTRWMVSLPLYHVGGLSIVFRSLFAGGCAVLPESRELGPSIVQHKPTHLSLVPTQLQRLLDSDAVPPLDRLDHVLIGGASVPDGLVARAVRAGINIHKSYGMTETASQVTTTPRGPTQLDLASSGRALPYREVRVDDDGRILVRGPILFHERLGDEPGEAFNDGWFDTGDVGRIDPEGRLRVLGRTDQMFVSGGENIHPEEIERAIVDSGLVDEAVVVAVADREFGHRPVAFIEPMTDARALRAHLVERLAGFKIPDKFLALPDKVGRLKPDRLRLARLARDAR